MLHNNVGVVKQQLGDMLEATRRFQLALQEIGESGSDGGALVARIKRSGTNTYPSPLIPRL